MRKLDRANIVAPRSLSLPSESVSTEITGAADYYAVRQPWLAEHISYKFTAYRGRDVKSALRQLAGGNCAYCESKIGAVGAREVEHYRPKGGIEGLLNHPGYWWLAFSWSNLLPTCRDCNKSLRQHIVSAGMTRAEVEVLSAKTPKASHGKANQFDVVGTRALVDGDDLTIEDPLLIDPCERDPALELQWDFEAELTLIEPKVSAAGYSMYGAYTINTCALNRAELVLDRIPVVRQLRALRVHIVKRLNNWAGDHGDLADIMDEVGVLIGYTEPEQPYSGMAAAFVRDLEEEIEGWRLAYGLPPF